MHQFELSSESKAKLVSRLGRPFMIEAIDPARTALIVVDMQNYFVAPGYPFETPVAREIVPHVNRLADGLRSAGGSVVWIENVAPDSSAADWPSYARRQSENHWKTRDEFLQPGHEGFALWPELSPQADDLRVQKTRFSAFIEGASELENILRARAIDTLLITGVATNICCESTARDAMMRGFDVIMVIDACAAPSDELHAASLTNFYEFFGDVRTSDEVMELMNA